MCGFLPTGGQRKTWAALSQECWRSLQLDDVIQEKSCNSAWSKNGVQGTPRRLVNKLSWIWGPVEWEDTRECVMHNVYDYISYISFITKFLASLCFRWYASYKVIWEKAMIFEFSHICYICCRGRKFAKSIEKMCLQIILTQDGKIANFAAAVIFSGRQYRSLPSRRLVVMSMVLRMPSQIVHSYSWMTK